jgi:predicted RND superfamily exporter protein
MTRSVWSGRATSAPADVHIVATGKDRVRDPEVFETAERLTRELEAAGLTVSTTTGRRSARG